MYNKVSILEKIGWYQNAEIAAHDKLTDLFNCMVDYFNTNDKYYCEGVPDDIYVGGYYPMNPQLSFGAVIKKAHHYLEANQKSLHKTYVAYCNFLKSPYANEIASDTTYFINNNLESKLIDEFISKTYGQIF